MAYYELEPFGNSWRQTARLCALQQNMNCGKGRAMKEDEFMPVQKEKQQTTTDLAKFLRAMANKAKPE